MSTIQERVSRGIELLDKHGPKDWRECIDIHTLTIASSFKCVLGQVYDQEFTDRLKKFGRAHTFYSPFDLGWRDLSKHIGNGESAWDYGFDGLDFDELDFEWDMRLCGGLVVI